MVVLTADHGESLGEHGELTHGYFAYNSTIHVPLIIAGPGTRPGRVAANVSHVDIFPTACRLLGLPEPPGLHGRSLVPLIKGGKRAEQAIYFESLEPTLNYGCAPLRGFLEGATKYMDSPLPEVYDLDRDSGEKANLAPTTDLPALRKKLEALENSGRVQAKTAGAAVADERTRENLRSLGYLASPVAQLKASYGAEDDLKNFLPFAQRLERAILLDDAGKNEECIRELTALLLEKKSFTPAYVYLAGIQAASGRAGDALQTLADGVGANPGDYTLLSEYGKALVRNRRFGEAVGVLERAVSLTDFDPESWNNLGLAFMRVGESAKALEALAKALALDPSSAMTHADIGSLHLEMYLGEGRAPGDLAQAISSFEKAVLLDPGLNPAFRGLGYAYRMAGRTGPAMTAWEKAVALSPDDDFSTYNLGLICLENGDRPRAKKLFNSILELRGPDLPPADRDRLLALIEKCK